MHYIRVYRLPELHTQAYGRTVALVNQCNRFYKFDFHILGFVEAVIRDQVQIELAKAPKATQSQSHVVTLPLKNLNTRSIWKTTPSLSKNRMLLKRIQ